MAIPGLMEKVKGWVGLSEVYKRCGGLNLHYMDVIWDKERGRRGQAFILEYF